MKPVDRDELNRNICTIAMAISQEPERRDRSRLERLERYREYFLHVDLEMPYLLSQCVAYIKESEEVKYNGLQPLVVEIGIGEYMWEDFGITQKHYDTWKKLILSGHPSIESFGILNFNGASYDKLSRVVYENGVIILFFSDTPSELKVYSDGRCEIPPGGDIIK